MSTKAEFYKIGLDNVIVHRCLMHGELKSLSWEETLELMVRNLTKVNNHQQKLIENHMVNCKEVRTFPILVTDKDKP